MPDIEIYGKTVSFPDSLSPDELNRAASMAAQQMKGGSRVVQNQNNETPGISAYLSEGQKIANETPGIGTILKVQNAIRSGANKLGDVIAEQGPTLKGSMAIQSAIPGRFPQARPLTPNESALIGTTVAMAPDIIMSGTVPEAQAIELTKISPLQELSVKSGMKGLGFTKRFLKNKQLMKKAEESVGTLLEEGRYPSGNVEDMADSINRTAQGSGNIIGRILKKFEKSGTFLSGDEAISEIEKLRPRTSDGQILKGGEWKGFHDKIDNAIETIKAFGKEQKRIKLGKGNLLSLEEVKEAPKISWSDSNKIKTTLQDLSNYKTNDKATLFDKVIAATFRKVQEKGLENAAINIDEPRLAQIFQRYKKLYGAAMNATDPIYNRLSSELGNKGISLTDWIVGSGQLASGRPMAAVATVAIKKAAEKRLPQIVAKGAHKLSKTKAYRVFDKIMGANMKSRFMVPDVISGILQRGSQEDDNSPVMNELRNMRK